MSWSHSVPSSSTNTSPCSVGFIVPASTFTYGSILMAVTSKPRDCRIFPMDAEAMPLPTPDITPPTTKMNFVLAFLRGRWSILVRCFVGGMWGSSKWCVRAVVRRCECLVYGEKEEERRAAVQLGLRPHISAMGPDDVARDPQPQSGTVGVELHRIGCAEELRKYFINILRRNANARIANADLDIALILRSFGLHDNLPTGHIIPHRVVHEVRDDHGHLLRIYGHGRELGLRPLKIELQPRPFHLWHRRREHAVQELHDACLHKIIAEPSLLHLGDVQKILYDIHDAFRRHRGLIEQFARIRGDAVVLHNGVERPVHLGDGCPQLMRNDLNKLVLGFQE